MYSSYGPVEVELYDYGGVAGIATIEYVLEEIVGESADEHDPAEPEIQDLGDGSFRVPARAGISEVGDLFGLEIDDDDVRSEEHTSELQSRGHLVCRLLLEKKK